MTNPPAAGLRERKPDDPSPWTRSPRITGRRFEATRSRPPPRLRLGGGGEGTRVPRRSRRVGRFVTTGCLRRRGFPSSSDTFAPPFWRSTGRLTGRREARSATATGAPVGCTPHAMGPAPRHATGSAGGRPRPASGALPGPAGDRTEPRTPGQFPEREIPTHLRGMVGTPRHHGAEPVRRRPPEMDEPWRGPTVRFGSREARPPYSQGIRSPATIA